MTDYRYGASLLLCPPTFFDVSYSINPWMDPEVPVDRTLAAAQWIRFVSRLRETGRRIELVDPAAGCPDMVFLGDAGLVRDNTFLCSRFRHPERQPEAQHYATWFDAAGYDVTELPAGALLEGYGDIVNFEEMTVLGHGPRSNRAGLDAALEFLPFLDVVAEVDLPDERFYHLAAALAILSRDTLLYYPPAFRAGDAAKLRELAPNAIEVSTGDLYEHQACNVVVLDRTVFMDGCSASLRSQLEEAGFEIELFPVSELKKGGGSLKCLVLPTVDEETPADAVR